MKKIFILLLFFSAFISSVFGQKELGSMVLGGSLPAPATTSIITCGVLTLTITSTDPSCNGVSDGTATVQVSGGVPPYKYLWTPTNSTTSTITGLIVDTYGVQVWDAVTTINEACFGSIALVNPAPLIVNITPPNPVTNCQGSCDGFATASGTGGTAPYSYSWNTVPVQTTGLATGMCAQAYVVTATDANGCTRVKNVSIGQPALLIANGSNTSITCFGANNGTASVAPTGGNVPYTYLWNTGATTSTISSLAPGTYSCSIVDSKLCSVTYAAIISEPPVLGVNISGKNLTCNSVCSGSVAATTSGGIGTYTYLWAPGGYTTSAVTGLCAGTYTLSLWDSNFCLKTQTITLTQPSAITSVPTGTNIKCNGVCDGTASVNAGGGTAPYTYLWTSGGYTTSAVTGLCANTYTIDIADANGCTSQKNITLTEPDPLLANPLATNATCFGICDGNVIVNATGGIGAYTYSWMPGGQTTSSISALCTGTYTLTLKDANNCSNTSIITIGQNTILSTTVASTNNSCHASCNGAATISISGGTSPYTYNWTGGQTTSTATGLCANNYTVIVNDAIGCQASGSMTITEPAVLTTSVASINPLCNASCNGSITTTPSGGVAPYSYLWVPGNLTTSAISGLCANNYTLTLSDANNCSSTNTVTLTDPAVLAATFTVTDASCSSSCNGLIDITPEGGTTPYNFNWAPGVQTTEDATGLCAGDYTLTITDTNACTASYTMALGAKTVLVAIASTDTSFCSGGTASLMSSSVNATTTDWYQLPAWTLVGSIATVSVTPQAGLNTYALVVSNGSCSDTDSVVVTVNNYPLVIVNDTTVCLGSTATICASGTNNYQWFQLPAWTATDTGNCISITPPAGVTNYAIIGSNGFCSDTDSVAVTVLAPPVANAGVDTAICQGASVNLCGTQSQNGVAFNWFVLPDWTPGDTDTCTIVVSPLITTDYGLVVSNGACYDTDTVSVTINAVPVADAGWDVTILASASTVLNGTGGGTYLWSPAAGLSSTTLANPAANPSSTITYTLIVTDANGCTSTDSVKVTIVKKIIPNDGLSPNGDGINDVWVIPNIEQFPDALIEVYNRWGELLFHSIGYPEKWDVTYKGKELPVGTYYYVINLNSDLYPEPITGPITILR